MTGVGQGRQEKVHFKETVMQNVSPQWQSRETQAYVYPKKSYCLQLFRNTSIAQREVHLKLLDVESEVTTKTQRAGFVPSKWKTARDVNQSIPLSCWMLPSESQPGSPGPEICFTGTWKPAKPITCDEQVSGGGPDLCQTILGAELPCKRTVRTDQWVNEVTGHGDSSLSLLLGICNERNH